MSTALEKKSETSIRVEPSETDPIHIHTQPVRVSESTQFKFTEKENGFGGGIAA